MLQLPVNGPRRVQARDLLYRVWYAPNPAKGSVTMKKGLAAICPVLIMVFEHPDHWIPGKS